MDFVCKSLRTAIESLSSWYHIDVADFNRILRQNYQTYFSSSASYELFYDYLYQQLTIKFDNTESLPRVHWFHGARYTNPSDYDIGLLPLKSIWPTLQKRVDDIACKHKIPRTKKTTEIDNQSAFLIDEKLSSRTVNDGPFAMLNYEALIFPERFGYDYLDMPEIVRDYAELKYGKRADEVLILYRNASKPTIIEFWGIPDGFTSPRMEDVVKKYLIYIYGRL